MTAGARASPAGGAETRLAYGTLDCPRNALALLVSTQLAGLLLLAFVLVTAPTVTRSAAGQLLYRLNLWLK